MNGPADDIDNLRWQCRRGMLELDLMLNNYLEHGLRHDDESDRSLFSRLLSYPDQTLYDLLMGNIVSTDNSISVIVDRIRRLPFDGSSDQS